MRRNLRGGIGLLAVVLAAALAACESGTTTAIKDPPPPPAAPVATGALKITILGLTDPIRGRIEVTGPTIFHRTVTRDTVIHNLIPGPYLLVAQEIQNGGQDYGVLPSTESVEIAAGQTAAVVMSYDRVVAGITVNVVGFPANAPQPVIGVDGPDGLTSTYTGSFTALSLPIGVYTIRPQDAFAEQERFSTGWQPPGRYFYLVPGGITVVQATYQRVTAPLEVTIDGLPAGVDATVRAKAEARPFDVTVPQTQTFHGLQVDWYNVVASPVVTPNGTYLPTPDSTRLFVSTIRRNLVGITYNMAP